MNKSRSTIIKEDSIYLTRGARDSLSDIEAINLLRRFNVNDYGKLCTEDKEQNLRSIKYNTGMVMGSYSVDDIDIWVISYLGDNGYTTILLPEEY